MTTAPECRIGALGWHTVAVDLRNTRNTFAREHPLWVLHGLLAFAAPRTLEGAIGRFWFRARPGSAPPGDRVQRGRTYAIDVILPTTDAAVAEGFMTALQRHLDPAGPDAIRRNFVLERVGPARRRSLADLEAEMAAWPTDTDEVCLDFQTPLPFTPADKERPWLLDAAGLGALLVARVEKLFGVRVVEASAMAPVWAAARTLPAYWHYVAHEHRPKSTRGVQLLHGNVGPLPLRGDLAALRPWILLGLELGAGRKLGAGAGAFAIEWHRAH